MNDRVLASRWLFRSLARLLVAAALFASGCRQPVAHSPDLALTHTITPSPLRVGRAEISLTLKDSARHPVSGAHVALEQNMSHPGMPPIFGEAREIAPGNYAGQLDLTMAGDWFVLVHLTLADGQKLDKQIELKGVETK
jgi:hypothetical protein